MGSSGELPNDAGMLCRRYTRRAFLQGSAVTAGAALALSFLDPRQIPQVRAASNQTTSLTPAPMVAATATIDITPSAQSYPTMYLNGFAYRGNTPASGVGLNLIARALALKDANGTKVIVSTPILAFPRALYQQVLTGASQQYGVAQNDLLLTATHTHNGPALSASLDPFISYDLSSTDIATVDSYTTWLGQQLIALIGQAVNGLATAPQVTLSWGVGFPTAAQEFAVNRRDPYNGTTHYVDGFYGGNLGQYPTDVPVLAVKRVSDGGVVAVVFSYACHPITAGDPAANSPYLFQFHPDFPGVASNLLETAYPGAVALFLQGTAGDIDPDPHGAVYAASDPPAYAGQLLSQVVSGVLSSGTALQPLDGPIATRYAEINLPLDIGGDHDVQTLLSLYQQLSGNSDVTDWVGRHAISMSQLLSSPGYAPSVPMPVSIWRFQSSTPLVLFALGEEPVVGYGLSLKQTYGQLTQTNPERVWVAGYANQVAYYLPSEEVIQQPGYEAGWHYNQTYPAGFALDSGASTLYYGLPSRLLGGESGVEPLVLSTLSTLMSDDPKSGWQSADVDSPAQSGTNSVTGTTWTVTGGGVDIWGTADQFRFVWQNRTNDGALSARTSTLSATGGPYAKAGLMLRADTSAGAAHYFVQVEPGGMLYVTYRPSAGASTQVAASAPVSLPAYMRITRAGGICSASLSSDGVTWQAIAGSAVQVGLPSTLLAGMAVTSQSTLSQTTATFDAVTLSTFGWVTADIGNPAFSGTAVARASTWVVSGVGSDIWGTVDQFRFVWQNRTGDTSFVARLGTLSATGGPYAKAGMMLRAGTSAGAAHYFVQVEPGGMLYVTYRPSAGASTQAAAAMSVALPVLIRVTRMGGMIVASTSPDGVTWTAIPGSNVALAFPSTLLAGMAVTSQSTVSQTTATFDAPVLRSTGWTSADIGLPALPGSDTYSDGGWTVSGCGTDIWGTADQFHYVWQYLGGDVAMSALFNGVSYTGGSWAKAGLMFRVDLSAGAPHYFAQTEPDGTLFVTYRATVNSNTQIATSMALGFPTFVRITRSGNTFTTYTSPDGQTWTTVPGSSITLSVPATALVGMAVTSQSSSSETTASFDNVTFG